MSTLEKWLTHNPHLPLRRVPSEWDGCAFWQVDTGLGRHLVLAPNEDYAERAVLRYFGEANRPTAIEGPMAFPVLPLAGWSQYLDAVMVLEGDPAKPAMRAPDSSAALDTELAFMDSLNWRDLASSKGDWRWNMSMSDRCERMHEKWARIEALRADRPTPRPTGWRAANYDGSHRWVGEQDPSKPPPGRGWSWIDAGAGGQWIQGEHADIDRLPVPVERRPPADAPIRSLIGYLLRTPWRRLRGRR